MRTSASNSGRGLKISLAICSPSNNRSWRDEVTSPRPKYNYRVTKEVMRGARNSLFDVKYTLLPTMEFINEVKKANSRALQLLKQRGSLLPEKGIGEAMG